MYQQSNTKKQDLLISQKKAHRYAAPSHVSLSRRDVLHPPLGAGADGKGKVGSAPPAPPQRPLNLNAAPLPGLSITAQLAALPKSPEWFDSVI